jgi:hypothetical protein
MTEGLDIGVVGDAFGLGIMHQMKTYMCDLAAYT